MYLRLQIPYAYVVAHASTLGKTDVAGQLDWLVAAELPRRRRLEARLTPEPLAATDRALLEVGSWVGVLREAASCPSARGEHERFAGQQGAAVFAQLGLPVRVEARHVGARRADATGERLPPLVKARVLEAG